MILATVLFLPAGFADFPVVSGDRSAAREILDTAGIKTGLCIHLGCGNSSSPDLTAALAANSAMLVHGLAFDDESLARARKAIEERGVPGRAMAEKGERGALPYLRDLANLVVIEDPDAVTKQGITREEILRIVSPNGVLCARDGGKWTKTVKPRPQAMDEWTHPWHSADGNMVSTDKVFEFPLGFRWIDGLPMNVTQWASCRGWVIAGGRCYTLGLNELENLGPPKKRDQFLSARDAYSGLPLWKINCETTTDAGHLHWRNAGPIVADSRRVCAPQTERVIIVDGATGRIAAACPTKYPAVRLLLLGGTLVASCWEERVVSSAPYDGASTWASWYPKSTNGAVQAFDADTGSLKWTLPFPAYMAVASDGMLFLLTQTGNPPKERQVVAVELATGTEKWRIPHTVFGSEPDIQITAAGPGYVVIAKRKDKAVFVLSRTDGKVLWKIQPAAGVWTPIVDGMLWQGASKYDIMTGEAKGSLPVSMNDLERKNGCQLPTIIGGRYIAREGGRECEYYELPPPDAADQKPTPQKFHGARGACLEGMTTANGMFYTAQNGCHCCPGSVYGFVAVGPCGSVPSSADFGAHRPMEKGPAFGVTDPSPVNPNDWPMFRHDSERTSTTSTAVPAVLRVSWKMSLARAGEGMIGEAWKARLASCLSAPVVAGGMAFVAATDVGQVIALDAAAGTIIWTVTLGSRIDTPPTIHKGLCLIGCHDGWVYALRAGDGQLAWRMRVAPLERRMVAWGLVESVWPAVGTVLVHGDIAYANAGRTSEADGGIAVVAFKPETGETLWTRVMPPGHRQLNDLLDVRNDSLAWRYIRLDLKSGKSKPLAPKISAQGGMMDGSWTVTHKRRAGNAFVLGRSVADLMAWNDKLVVTPSYAVDRSRNEAPQSGKPEPKNAGNPDTPKPIGAEEFSWQPALPGQVEAMAMAGNAVFYAGRPSKAETNACTGFIVAVSIADGRNLWELSLDSPPTYDGLAVARDRVYLSLQDGTLLCFDK